MSVKQNKVKEPKAPRTIKVKTLVVIIVWTMTVTSAFVAGWFVKGLDNERVHTEARVMLNQLVDTKETPVKEQTQSK